MALFADDRAQSIQIGAVLLFGILIIMLAVWQAFVVPNQNEEIEFNHNQQLQEQMTELRSTVISMPGATNQRSVPVDLGVRYPSRAVFVNPGPASGTVQTVDTTNESIAITIDNATAAGETGDFWNGEPIPYNTGSIQYQPNYNLYTDAPRTIYEHSVLFNQFDNPDTRLTVTEQAIIDDDRITLVAINGTLREDRTGSTSVDVRPVSTQTRTVEIENSEEGNITIELPTRLDAEQWEELLENEDRVVDVRDSGDGVVIELEEGSYELQMAKVGFGRGITQTEETYMTDIRGDGERIQEGETESLVVEVRDEYNNPVRGVTVYGEADEGDLEEDERSTGSDGRAEFMYDASGVQSSSDNIDFSYLGPPDESFDGGAPENVSMTVDVRQEPTGGTGEQLPGPRPTNLTLASDDVPEGETLGIINASFDNQGTTEVNRGGTDVVAGEFYIVEEGTPDEGEGEPLDPFTRNLQVSTTGEIDTDELNLDSGNYTAAIRGQDTRGIWTNETVDANAPGRTAEFEVLAEPFFDVTITGTNSPIDESETLIVDATIENTGGQQDNQTIELLDFDGTVVDSEEVSLNGTESQDVTLEWNTESGDAGTDDITVQSEDTADTEEVTIEALEPFFDVTIDDYDEDVTEGEDVNVDVTIENTGDAEDTQTIELNVDNDQDGNFDIGADDTQLTLDSGQSESITLTYTTQTGDSPEIDFEVTSDQDREERTVTVNEPDDAFFAVTIDDYDEEVTEGEDISVDYTIENTGNQEETQEIQFLVDGGTEGTETVTLGEGQTFSDTFTYTTETGDAPEVTVEVASEDDSDERTVTVNEPAFFEVVIDNYDEEVIEGDPVTVDYTIENTGDVEDTQDIEFLVDGEIEGTENGVTLAGDQTFSDTFTYTTETGDAPEVTVEVASDDDSDERTVTVNEPAFFDVTIDNYDEEVTEGDPVTVEYTIENTGDVEGTQDIEFLIDGEIEETEGGVTLAGDQTFSDTFTYTTETGDAPAITVEVASDDDSDERTVTVNEPAFFEVTIDDYDEEVTEGDTVTVEYTIENTGDLEDTQNIQFNVDDGNEDTREDLTLGPGDTDSGSFTYTTEEGDSPEITVEVASDDDSEERDVTVNEALAFSYSEEPFRYTNQQDDIEFEIRNDGDEEVRIAEFELRDVDDDYNSFQSYTISPPQGQDVITGSGGFNVDERVTHDDYAIAPEETATYQLDDFDVNNMNNEEFQLVIYTADGRQYDFGIISI